MAMAACDDKRRRAAVQERTCSETRPWLRWSSRFSVPGDCSSWLGTLKRELQPQAHSCTRRAVTLLEVLLVLAVLAMLAAAVWPSLDRSLADQRMRDAADMIRAQWAQAQVRAVATGEQQRFRIEPDGRRYWIESARCAGDAAWAAPVASAAALPSGQPSPDQRLLPDGVTFGDLDVEPPSQSDVSWPGNGHAGGTVPGMDNLYADDGIMFYPDGTCSSARLTLRNGYDRCLTISLRGLTAVATVGDVLPVEDAVP